jgi:hypothetical protein
MGFLDGTPSSTQKKPPECRKCIFARFDLEIDENRQNTTIPVDGGIHPTINRDGKSLEFKCL